MCYLNGIRRKTAALSFVFGFLHVLSKRNTSTKSTKQKLCKEILLPRLDKGYGMEILGDSPTLFSYTPWSLYYRKSFVFDISFQCSYRRQQFPRLNWTHRERFPHRRVTFYSSSLLLYPCCGLESGLASPQLRCYPMHYVAAVGSLCRLWCWLTYSVHSVISVLW